MEIGGSDNLSFNFTSSLSTRERFPEVKKAPKYDLAKHLLQLLDKESIVVNKTNQIPHVKTTAVVVDFMAIIRKWTSVKLKDVKIFGSFCKKILNNVTS